MKSTLYLALLCITITTSLSAKARLGEYFLGFGYSMAEQPMEAEEPTTGREIFYVSLPVLPMMQIQTSVFILITEL